MPVATRTFRVFVSSTFEDLEAERDALQAQVFPALRKLCEEHGARFQAIDLRWGVRDEAALDQKTVEICLREIDRCQKTGIKPNFIVLLGQRYGWRPLPARIEATEFEVVRARIADSVEREMIDGWYDRDDNAVPAEFVLKPRIGKWVDAKEWEKLEARLHGILLAAARAAGLSEDDLIKYWASATHQEILEGLGKSEDEGRHVFAFCRNVPDTECDPDLAELRGWLKTQLPEGNFVNFEPEDLAGLCKRVEKELTAIIESEAKVFESKPALELEKDAQDKFARERSLVFGRDEVLKSIVDYLRGESKRLLVLRGASGSGKSAVMARASEDTVKAHPSAVIVRRFIGASPDSSNGLTLLRSLCEQIGAEYGAGAEIPVEFNVVACLFGERLSLARADRPLIVFLDALDQLGKDDPARSLYWLSGVLPDHCRIVVSTTELASALSECELLEVKPLPENNAGEALVHWMAAAKRTLMAEQRQHLLAAINRCGLPLYLKLAFEEVRTWASSLPLAECKLGESVEGVIDTLLNRLSLEANHGPLLVSRSLGYLAAARYGLTEDEMLDVLSADEEVWQDLLSRAHHTPPERRLPVIVWSRLFLDLEPYLTERSTLGGTVVSFYHRQLADRVTVRFLAGDEKNLRHQSLATYFAGRTNWLDDETRKLPNVRKAAELPWEFSQSPQPSRLAMLLGDVGFLEAKISAGMSLDMLEDFRRFDGCRSLSKEASPEVRELFRETATIWRVLGNILDQVTVDPASIGMQIGVELQNLGLAALHEPREGALLRRLDQATNDRPCFSRFSGGVGVPYLAQTEWTHDSIHFLRFSADGRELLYVDAEGRIVRWSWSAPVIHQTQPPTTGGFGSAAIVSNRFVMVAGESEVWVFSHQNLWDDILQTGTWRRVLACESGERLGPIGGCPLSGIFFVPQVAPEAARILRFHGLERIKPLRLPSSGGAAKVTHMTVDMGEREIAVGFSDGTLAISTGFCRAVHRSGILACAFLKNDSEVASIDEEGVFRIQDLAGTLRCESRLLQGSGTSLSYCPQHQLIAVGHRSGYVSLVSAEESDSETGNGFWPGLRGGVASICFSPCGNYLAVGGSRGMVRVFAINEIQRRSEPRSIGQRGFPAGPIRDVAFLNRDKGLVFLDQQQRIRTNLPSADSRYLPFGANCFCVDNVNGKIVAARNDEIYFLSSATGQIERVERIGGTEKLSIAVSSDDRFLALLEDAQIIICRVHERTISARYIDLASTPYLSSKLRPLNRVPLRFCRNNRLLAVPLESTVLQRRNAHGVLESDLQRTLLFIDVVNGAIAGTLEYQGFCRALDELPDDDILIVGLGCGIVHSGAESIACPSPKGALLFFSIETGQSIHSVGLVAQDFGVTGIAAAREGPLCGCIVASFESGRIRLTSLKSKRWAASICLPDPAAAIRWAGPFIQAADSGARRGNWPALHEFTLHFPIANESPQREVKAIQ
jgi:WD40 repeat protein